MNNDISILNISQNLIDELNAADVRWFIWKGCYHFKDGFNGIGDIDLLIHTEDHDIAIKLLKKTGFLRFITQKYMQKSCIEDWIGVDTKTCIMVHVHLYFAMVFGDLYVNQYNFTVYDACFKDALTVDCGIKIQNPCWEYLLFVCRLQKEKISSKKIEKSLSYFQKHVNREEFEKLVCEVGISDRFVNFIFNLMYSKNIREDLREKQKILTEFVSSNTAVGKIKSYRRRIEAKLVRIYYLRWRCGRNS